MAIVFDPINKRIILDSAYVSAAQIYSRWKEWVTIDDNAKYDQALRVLGGDPLGGSLYAATNFFLMNGWRIRPMESDHALVITGTITVDGGGNPIVNTLGNHNVVVQLTVPVQAQGIATSGSSTDVNAIISAMQAMFETQLVLANVKEVAGKPVRIYDGTNWL
jgi:hypothetical protein